MGRVWLSDYTAFLTYIKNDVPHPLRVFPETVPFNIEQFYYYDGLILTIKENEFLIIAGSHSACTLNLRKYPGKNIFKTLFNSDTASGKIIFTGSQLVSNTPDGIGYWNFKKGIKEFYKYPSGRPEIFLPRTSKMVVFGHYLIGLHSDTSKMLIRFNLLNGQYEKTDLNSIFPGCKRVRVISLNAGKVQISTNAGMVVMDENGSFEDTFRVPEEIKKTIIRKMYRDLYGNYWIASFNDGLFLISREMKNFRTIAHGSGADFKNIKTIYPARDGYFLMNDEEKLFLTDSSFNVKRQWNLGTDIGKISDPKASLLFYDSVKKGHYILSTNGVYFLDGENKLFSIFERLKEDDTDFLLNGINSFKSGFFDQETGKIVFLNYGFVYEIWYDNRYFYKKKVLKRRFTNMVKDDRGRYWFSNDLGNILITDTGFNTIASLSLKTPVSGLLSDNGGNIILALEGYGVFIYNTNSHKVSMLDNVRHLQTMVLNGQGLWLASNNALNLFELKGTAYIPGSTFYNFKKQIYQRVYSIFPGKDSFLLLCDRGILKAAIQTTPSENDGFRNSAFVTEVRAGGRVIRLQKNTGYISLPFTGKNLKVSFTSNSAPYLGDIHYRYLLEPEDEIWQRSNDEFASYPALKPGRYRFRLKAVVNHSDIISSEKQLTIEILPLWWQTLWFRILVGLLILFLLACLYYMRIRFIRRREAERTLLNKKISELELSALQAQMNPHFIFNALTAIQSFIRLKDVELAEELLKKFSLLIRLYLEFSRNKKIPLTQELRALRLYAEIEQLRFNNKFDIIIKVRSRQPVESVLLPPMIIQPLVENAINHGLYHKPARGLLKIVFWVRDKEVIVFIDDNGIGRKASRKLRSKLFPSRGNVIIKERIEILKATGLASTSIKIIDKYDKENQPAGTRIVLKMSLV